jgi:hypothetical protein
MFARQLSILLLILVTALPARTSRIDTTRPATPLPQFMLQVAAGSAGAYVGFLAVGGGFMALSLPKGDVLMSFMGSSLLGTVVGMPLGSAAAVHLVGSRGDKTGSLLVSTMTSAMGMYLGGSIMTALHVPVTIGVPISAGLGAAAGFNLTRHYKKGYIPTGENRVLQSSPTDSLRTLAPLPLFMRQLTAGSIGGYLGFFTGFFGSTLLYREHHRNLYIFAGATFFGTVVGGTAFVHQIGRVYAGTGSFIFTAIGSVLGMPVAWHMTSDGELPAWTFPIFPALGATLANHLARHIGKSRAPTTAISATPYLSLQQGAPLLGVRLTLP